MITPLALLTTTTVSTPRSARAPRRTSVGRLKGIGTDITRADSIRQRSIGRPPHTCWPRFGMTLTAGGTVRTKEEDEELAMAAYYRECRDYWRRQAESLAARWDKHMRAEHKHNVP